MPEPRRPLRRPTRTVFDHGEPISRPVLAPLAAIWLVAAALAAASYSMQTHALLIDLPLPSMPYPADQPLPPIRAVSVGVDRTGSPVWQGQPVTQERFVELANDEILFDRAPIIVFAPHPDARFDDAVKVLAILAQAGLTRSGFCFGALEEHAQFGKASDSSGGLPLLAVAPSFILTPPAPPKEQAMQPGPWTDGYDCERAEAMLR